MKRNFFVSFIVCLGLSLALPSYGATNEELEQDIKKLEKQLKKLKKKSDKRYKKLKSSIDELSSRLEINGFATASLAKADEAAGAPNGITDNGWSTQSDDIMGLQMSFMMNEKASYTIQMVSKHASDNHAVRTEWSYFAYQINNKLRFRAGRIRIPYYMLSESVEVGYSYNWVRPPTELYNLSSNNAEMMDLTYQHSFGLFNTTSRLWVGRQADIQNLGGGLEMIFTSDNIVGFTFDVNKGPYSGHFGALYVPKVSNTFSGSEEGQQVTALGGAAENLLQTARAAALDVDPMLAAFSGVIAAGEAADISYSLAGAGETTTDDIFASVDGVARITEGREIQHINSETYYVNIGGAYDNGTLQIMGEFTRFDIENTLLQGLEGGYLAAAYRVSDKWTPFITYSTTRTHNNRRERAVTNSLTEQLTAAYAAQYGALVADPTVQGIAAGMAAATSDPIWTPEYLVGATAGTIAAVTSGIFESVVSGFQIKSNTKTIGVRYDLMPGVAFKAQLDASEAEDGFVSAGGLGGPGNPDKVKVLSFAIDTVF